MQIFHQGWRERLETACHFHLGRGAGESWDQLLSAIQPFVHRIARRDFGLNGDDSEDVYQMVCLKVYERLQQLQQPAAFRVWLRQITRNVIVDFLRQRKEMMSLEHLRDTIGLEPEDERSDASWLDRLGLRLDLERAVRSLPEKYRVPLVLHVLEGAPQEEISARLGRPRSTIATQIQRGLARLRRTLAPWAELS